MQSNAAPVPEGISKPTACEIFQDDSQSVSGVEEEDVLLSRASLLHRQRDRAQRLPSPSTLG